MKTTITMKFNSLEELNAWFDACCTRCCVRNCEWQDCSVCQKNQKYKEIMKKMGYEVEEEDN